MLAPRCDAHFGLMGWSWGLHDCQVLCHFLGGLSWHKVTTDSSLDKKYCGYDEDAKPKNKSSDIRV